MGLIYFMINDIPITFAYGGYKNMTAYFKEKYDTLVSLALMFGGSLHFMYMDEAAWSSFSRHANLCAARYELND